MKTLLLIGCLIGVTAAAGQAPSRGVAADTVAPFLSAVLADSGIVVVGRREEAARDLTSAVESVSATRIARAQSLTTADALADLSGVYVQKSQFGGGSPVVRGFEANRVLLVVDGVRMNNAIYRAGHLHNAISVDPRALARLEVLYGAGALAYGSDAIGGVIHFRTRRPRFRARPQDAVEGAVTANFTTAARALTQAGRLEYGGPRWAGLTLLSTSTTKHLRAGARRPDRFPDFGKRPEYLDGGLLRRNDRPNVQVGTAYAQYNLLQKLRFRLADRLELDVNLQFSTTTDVPRYDALTERRDGRLRWARWDYGPQTRTLGALRLQDRRPTRAYDLVTYLLSHQFVAEDRLRRRNGDPQLENDLVGVHATNLQVDFRKQRPGWDLRYGLDLRHDRVRSQAFLSDVRRPDAPPEPLSSRYPSAGSTLTAGGAYLDASHPLGAGYFVRGGLRYSLQGLDATFGADDPVAWPRPYLEGVGTRNGALTGTLGLRRNAGPGHWRLLYAQGFRAPNLDDFAKFRERSGRIQVPNPGLRPERSHTAEAGFRRRLANDRLTVSGTVYHTWLRAAIVRRDGTLPDGRATFVSRGDTLLVQTNVNATSARVYGADLSVRWQVTERWSVRTDAHALRGRRRQEAPDGNVLTLPQDHIPPPYGQTTASYAAGPWTLDLGARYQLAKAYADYAVNTIGGTAATGYTFDRTGTSDNLEFTPFLATENRFAGSYGWWTLNARATYQATGPWRFHLKVDNALDRHYRPFASGVSAAGVDAGVGVVREF